MPRFAILGLAGLVLGGCADLATDPASSPASLRLSEEVVTVWENEPIGDLGVTVLDRRGNPIPSVPVWADLTWWSSNPFVVRPTGPDLTAVGPGQAVVLASLSGLEGSATVRVNPRSVRLDIAATILSQPGSPDVLRAGVETKVEIYLTADRANWLRPDVVVTLASGGTTLATLELERDGESIPRVLNLFDPTGAWTGTIPAEFFQPGLEISIEADPSGAFGHLPGSRDRYPRVGAFPVTVGEEAVGLRVAAAYLTQSVQRLDGSVPLVAGRDALLRVFLIADEANDLQVPVRAVFYRGEEVAHEVHLLNAEPGVPQALDEGSLSRSWNAVIPGSLLEPGMSLVVEADPDGTLPMKVGSRPRFPEVGGLALDVRRVPPLWVRMVPILQTSIGETGDITPANLPEYLAAATSKFPLERVEADIRSPYVTNSTATTEEGWLSLLNEIRALRVADGSDRYYYGVLRHPGGNGIGGLGFIGSPVAVGFDLPALAAETFAHELGHNFDLLHAPCGGASGTDPGYPYPGAGIGHYGFDFLSGSVKHPVLEKDLMSYCSPEWISDYNYEKVLARREAVDWSKTGIRSAEDALLVWGGVVNGRLVLEPAFRLPMSPRIPTETGAYRIRGLDDRGVVLFDMGFDVDRIDHLGAGSFAFAIPAAAAAPDRLAELVLSGPEGQVRRVRAGSPVDGARRPDLLQRRVEWDAAASPVALVRDAATGEIISFAREGRIDVLPRVVEVITSDGVRSTARTFDLR